MDKVSKKLLKATNSKEKKLSKKIKKLAKESKLEENVEPLLTIESVNKCKKEKIISVPDIEMTNETQVSDPTENQIIDNASIKENVQNSNSVPSAIILNLPADATKEELSNFLSNRGIPVDSLTINNGKYALIESEDPDILMKMQNLIDKKPLENNENMKISLLSGNCQRLEAFCQRNIILNKNIVIVKNINLKTNIEDILSMVSSDLEIKKHHVLKIRNKKQKTQMLTIEFSCSEFTDKAVESLNSKVIDDNKLIAEFKHELVEEMPIRTPSSTLMLKDLPESVDYQAIKNFELPTTKIQLVKKSAKRMCFLTFKTSEEASEAYKSLQNKEIDGNKISVKFVCHSEKSAEDVDNTRLHITNLPFTCSKEEMEKEFDFAQSIKFPLTSSGKSKGVCYLSFASSELAALAMESLKEKLIGGRKIKCNFAKKVETVEKSEKNKKDKIKKTKLVDNVITLFNLPKTVKIEDIKSKFDQVKFINIVKKGDIFKGIAEVHFINAKFAKAAIDAADVTIGGRPIRKELKGGKWRNGTEKKNKMIREPKESLKKKEDSD